jgi:hypothetical protein
MAQPLFQFVGKGKDHSPGSTRHAMDGQAALDLPAAHRALVALEKGGDLLPGVKPFPVLGLGRR